jgi:hypothetical protein
MQPTPEAPADATAQALHDAMQAHGAGHFDTAHGLYRQVLDARADHPDALHLLDLGVLLLFTLEAHADDGRTDFRLLECGRYSYRAGYAEAALQAAGFTGVERDALDLRMEAQLQVNGWLVSAGRPR